MDVPTINTTQTTVTQKCQRPENPQHNNLKLLRCGFSGRWHLWATVYLLPALARTQRHSVKYMTPIVVVTHSRSSDRVTAHLPHPRFTKYLTTILRSSYDNAKVTIDLQPPPPERSVVSGVVLKATGVSGNMHTTGKESTCSFRDMLVDRQTDRQADIRLSRRIAPPPCFPPPGGVGVKVTARRAIGYLFQSSDDESQGGKDVEIRRRCGAAANQRLRN